MMNLSLFQGETLTREPARDCPRVQPETSFTRNRGHPSYAFPFFADAFSPVSFASFIADQQAFALVPEGESHLAEVKLPGILSVLTKADGLADENVRDENQFAFPFDLSIGANTADLELVAVEGIQNPAWHLSAVGDPR